MLHITRIITAAFALAVAALTAPGLAADDHGSATAAQVNPVPADQPHAPVGADPHDVHQNGGHEAPGLLDVDLGSAVWTIVLFLVLLAVLGKFAWPAILKGLQDRETKMITDLKNAEKAAADAQRTLEEYKLQLAKAQEEAGKIIDSGKRNAERLAAQIQEEARAEIDELRKRTAGEIKYAKESALSEIYAQAAVLSTNLAGQILGREINPESHRALVDKALENVKN